MYGHLDKQPEMDGWDEGMGPWSPVLKEEKLYGRGGADDGYALFASLCVSYELLSFYLCGVRCSYEAIIASVDRDLRRFV